MPCRLFSLPRRLIIEMMLPKWFLALIVPMLLLADRAGLTQVQSVYLMPMGYGLDQYLANRLTSESVFSVVTDPKRADAVLTDQLGASFERRFDELFRRPEPAVEVEPPPLAPPAAATADGGKGPAAPPEKKEKEMDAEAIARLKLSSGQPPFSSFSRGKGNVFLVDIKTRQVLWSLYERPKKILPDELDRTSGRIVLRLKKDLAGKP